MLTFKRLGHHFGNRHLFSDLSLDIPESRVVLTGANGMGKTTLLLIAAGVLQPASGEACFQQHNVMHSSMRRRIGISASKVSLPGFFSVADMLAFHAKQFRCVKQTPWVETFGLTPFLNTLVGDLSLGNYKKLSLILAVMHEPELLLLDEPTNGLDDTTRTALEAFFNEYSGQLVIASHEPAALADVAHRHLHLDADGVHER